MGKRIVIFGGHGMIGSAIRRRLFEHDVTIPTSSQCPIENEDAVTRVLSSIRPHEVYICAAYTNVEKAESDSYSHQVNVLGVKNIVTNQFIKNTRVVFLSTAYVFDGKKREPYEVDDLAEPINGYGIQKLAGENFVANNCPNHLIIRTMGVYGKELARKNFAYQVIDNLLLGKIVYVPEEQYLAPTYAEYLAADIVQGCKDRVGVVHINGPKAMSKISFAKTVAERWGLDSSLIHPAPYQQKAKRPRNSVLKNSVSVLPFELGLEAFYDNH